MASNQYQSALEQARSEIKGMLNDFNEVDKKILQIAANAAKIGKTDFSGGSPKELNERLQKNATYRKQVNAEMKEAERLNKALAAAQAKFYSAQSGTNKQLQQTRFETNRLNRMQREAAVLSSKLSTEYEKQSTRLIQLKREAKGAAAQYGVNSKEARKLTAEANKLNDKLKRVDEAVGDHQRSVGNYGKAWQSAGKLITAAAGAFGVYSAMQIGRELYAEIKAINGLNKALEQVTQTQSLFNQSKTFLIDLAEETGVQINSLQQAYIKFYAASKTTNLSLEETQNLFRQTAKAGAVLNLSTDQVNGALTALEQMLSKGKVQAEEIRGQLGERLPGAFQILARSMGLTTAQLSKQLELGNVIADEVLPGFADELEKTFSLDKIDRVNTLAAAEGRLSTEWSKFAETLSNEEGSITKAISGALNLVTGLVKQLQELNRNLIPGLETNAFDDAMQRYEEMGEEAQKVAETDSKVFRQRINNLEQEKKALQERQDQLNENYDWFTKMTAGASSEYGKNKARIEELNNAIATNTGQWKAANNILIDHSDLLEEDTDAQTGNTDAKNKGIQALAGSIAAMEGVISKLEEEQSKLATNTQEWQQYQVRIDDAKDALQRFKDEASDFSNSDTFNVSDIDTSVYNVSDDEIEEGLKKDKEFWEEKLKNQKEYEDEKKKILQQSADFQNEIENRIYDFSRALINSLADIRIQKLDEELERSNAQYEALLANDRLTADQRLQIEEEQAQKQAEIQKEKEQVEKRAFLLEQGAALARVAIDTAEKIAIIKAQAAVLLANPITAPLAPLALSQIPLVLISGGLAAGTIAAQTIPALEQGDLTGKHEGLVQINDARGAQFKEIIQRANGEMEVYEGRNVLIDKKRGDKVYKAGTAPSGYDYNDIMNASINMSLADQHGRLSQAEARQSFDSEMIRQTMESELKKAVSAIKGIKINNTINNKSSDFAAYRAAKFKRRA